ncbi:MAG TPA: hypothetical protein VGS57_03120 [Thermoanaerobaculia bacterium]|jgi:hypothetical protein|nr:hypothetical protein [Thermoanaerobaculia bacterium]
MTDIGAKMPGMAVTMLGAAGPKGAFAAAVLSEVLGGLLPSSGPSAEEIALMQTEDLKAFFSNELTDVEIRDAAAHVETAYSWFKADYDRAKIDRGAVDAGTTLFMSQVNDALGPNSLLVLGISKLSDPRYRSFAFSTLSTAIGLKLTLVKIRINVSGDRSRIPAAMADIQNALDTIQAAQREADSYGLGQLQGLDGDAFKRRQDEVIQTLYQGDAGLPAKAMGRLSLALYGYQEWNGQ